MATKNVGDRNYLIREMPNDADNILNTLATLRGIRKWEIVREAMVEYAKNHKKDMVTLAQARTKPTPRTEAAHE